MTFSANAQQKPIRPRHNSVCASGQLQPGRTPLLRRNHLSRPPAATGGINQSGRRP